MIVNCLFLHFGGEHFKLLKIFKLSIKGRVLMKGTSVENTVIQQQKQYKVGPILTNATIANHYLLNVPLK